MSQLNYSSELLEQAVHHLSKLPGIGEKTALRLALQILRWEKSEAEALGKAIIAMRNDLKRCQSCNNISDDDTCAICANPARNHKLVCVVENVGDVMAIENTQQYNGIYHVLGGIISPMDGIGPGDLETDKLIKKAEAGQIKEVMLALSTTMEGDTTSYYLYKRLKNYSLAITTLARGVAFGDELEYADTVTLGRSIINRTEYQA